MMYAIRVNKRLARDFANKIYLYSSEMKARAMAEFMFPNKEFEIIKF